MIPPVTAIRHIDADHAELDLTLAADDPAFAGHFPGQPILPGVVQVDWAIRLAAQCFGHPYHPATRFRVKYTRTIPPIAQGLILQLRRDRARQEIAFEYRLLGIIASSGRFGFAD